MHNTPIHGTFVHLSLPHAYVYCRPNYSTRFRVNQQLHGSLQDCSCLLPFVARGEQRLHSTVLLIATVVSNIRTSEQGLSRPPKQRCSYILHGPIPRRNYSSCRRHLPFLQLLRCFRLQQRLGKLGVHLVARM